LKYDDNAAGVHGNGGGGAGWWAAYGGLYRARTAELITKGLNTSREDYETVTHSQPASDGQIDGWEITLP
jgi:hypothetical protein